MLMQFCQNLISGVFYLPLAFIFALIFKGNESIYYMMLLIVLIVGVIPISGWIFEVFAENSERIRVTSRER